MDFTPAMLPLAVTVPRGHHDGPFCRASLHVALCGRAPCLSPSRSVLAVLEPVSIAQAPGSTALPSEDLGQWHLLTLVLGWLPQETDTETPTFVRGVCRWALVWVHWG